MTVHLNDKLIPTLSAKGDRPETFYFDTEVQGLSIRARGKHVVPQRGNHKSGSSLYPAPADRAGSVVWGVQWKVSTHVRRATLGYWPQVTTKQARRAATILKGMGRDKHPRQHVEEIHLMMAYAGKLVEER